MCPGQNEVFATCKDFTPETCETIFQSADMKAPCSEIYPCTPGCNCATGYVRDKNNKCIKKEECRELYALLYE